MTESGHRYFFGSWPEMPWKRKPEPEVMELVEESWPSAGGMAVQDENEDVEFE